MSLTLTLTTPAAATYDLALDANHRYGVLAEDLPDLEQRIEQRECEFEAGELSLTCRNDDGWWDTLLAGADHLARYPSTFSLVVARDGTTRWSGDIDLLSVAYDRRERTVSFTVTGKLARLEKYSAETVRRAYPRYSDWGASTSVALNSLTDSTKAWTADAYINHVLIDSANTVFTITDNTATVLTVAGSPASGAYRIRQASWTTNYGAAARKLTSDGPTIATLGLLVGDKLRLIYTGEDPPRQVWTKEGMTWWYPFESKEVIFEVKHVGPSTYPSLTAQEIGVDQDMTIDFTEGDGSILDTPYHREKTVSQLAALLFEAAGLASGDYVVAVPTFDDNVVPYADFSGMNVAEALTDLAKVAGCVLSVTPTKYLFQPRDTVTADAGAGGSLDLIASEWTEQPIASDSCDFVRVEGADGQNVTRGLVGYLSNGFEFSSDWLIDYAWIKQVADRNWSVFGGTRTAAQVKILDGWGQNAVADPSFEGSAAIDASNCPWKISTATVISGEVLAKSTSYACHLRQSLKLKTLGTQIQALQLLYASNSVAASSSSGLLLTYESSGTAVAYASHNDGTEVVTLASAHGWAANTRIVLSGGTFGGLTNGGSYYVISPSGATLQVSLTSGGAAINLTAAAASGTPVFTPLTTVGYNWTQYCKVRFTTTGTLPTGLSLLTDYWTVRVGTSTCRVATSLANAVAGTVIAYTDAGTGIHTMTLQATTALAAGETVLLAGRAYMPSRTSGTLNLDLYGKDATGTVVLDSSLTYWNTTNTDFTEKRESVAIPAGCTHLWARIFAGGGANFEAYVDEVRVERTAKVAPCLLQRVYLGNETYQVIGIRESLKSSIAPSLMELELVGTTVTAASSAYDTTAEDATPPPPSVATIPAGVYELGTSTYTNVEIAWPYPDAQVAKLLYTVWNITDDRPDTGSTFDVAPSRKVGDPDTFVHTLSISGDVNANVKFVDYMVLYVDGRISPPSEPTIVPDAV